MNIKMNATVVLLAVIFAGCSTSPEPFETSDVLEISATVMAVDAQSRMLALRGPEGNSFTFQVGPDVRNLAQVQVGDTLTVSYYTGFLVAIAEPGNAGSDLEVGAARTAEGALPGGMIRASVRATVEFLSASKDGTAVSYRDADGQIQSVDVVTEEGQAFVRKLRQGDLVDIRYTEAIAIGVETHDPGE